MKKKILNAFMLIAGFVTMALPGISNATVENATDDKMDSLGLTDRLLQSGSINLNAQRGTLEIDERALVEAVRREIAIKMQSANLSADQRTLYFDVATKLKPGSFIKRKLKW